MKLNCLIIDDEPLAHKVILEYAKGISFLEIVGQCYLATEALSLLNNQAIDLIFLDINMPKLKGLDFLKTLQKKPIVIITSAYEEYALESFELSVCDYLLKPFRFERFLKAVNKALDFHQMKTQKNVSTPPLSIPKTHESNQIFIKSDKRLIQIDLAKIYYLESYGNYVKIWMEENCHLTPRTLSSFVTELPSSDFFRIHKSFIVHRKFIDYLEGNLLMMKNKKSLPIGKNHRADFKKFISSS
ncbi:MAG: LytR/AlgR family response regulator transcription factor [Saprospiraceae bacterium]